MPFLLFLLTATFLNRTNLENVFSPYLARKSRNISLEIKIHLEIKKKNE